MRSAASGTSRTRVRRGCGSGALWPFLVAPLIAACTLPGAAFTAGKVPTPLASDVAADRATYFATGALVEWLPTGAALLVCTGTLIAPRVVLTAAHCVANAGSRLPDFTTLAEISGATRANSRHSRRAYVHPAFDPRATGAVHDIALVELDSPLDDVAVERILDPAGASTAVAVGARVEILGYGVAADRRGLGGQRHAKPTRISGVAGDEIVIGGPGEAQDCVGDSGGPSFSFGADGSRRIAGVSSRSANNATECVDGSIHTRVDSHAEWIAKTLRAIDDGDTLGGPSVASAAPWNGGGGGFEGFAVVAVIGLVSARRHGRSRTRALV
jgi:secreted trypsin-like serine protease